MTDSTINNTDNDLITKGILLWQNSIVIDGAGVNASNWQRQRELGITATNLTLAAANDTFKDMLKRMDPYLMLLSIAPEDVCLIRSGMDIVNAKSDGKIGLIFGLQDGSPIDGDPMYVRILHQLGVRIIQLTYNERNALGDGCLEPENRGLTALGRQVVQEMNRLGMVIDLSHVGDKTSLEAIELSTQPCIFSHANPRALSKSPRNKPDHLIKAVADRGGVICLTPYAPFTEIETGVRPTIGDYFRLVEYVVNLAGIDHIGFGTDMPEGRDLLSFEITMGKRYPELAKGYNVVTRQTVGFDHYEGLKNISEYMLLRGYDDGEIQKFIGGNLLRLFRQVWL